MTLNEASYEGPDGGSTSTDILEQLTTTDKKRWVFRPTADFALGDHEFTVKATDAAGNDNTVSITFTVIERKPVEVSLSPGWNLISFRGAPASLDVNTIFSSDSVERGVAVRRTQGVPVDGLDARRRRQPVVVARGQDDHRPRPRRTGC